MCIGFEKGDILFLLLKRSRHLDHRCTTSASAHFYSINVNTFSSLFHFLFMFLEIAYV